MRIIMLIVVAATLAGCSTLKKTFGIKDSTPAHREPKTTSIWGEWVLASSADSTAFAGASTVELSLNQSSFTITANYLGQAPVVVRGTAAMGEGGMLTMIPQSSAGASGRMLAFVAGRPITLLASAAGGALVFAPPTRSDPTPSSVWNRRELARAAGQLGVRSARDTARP